MIKFISELEFATIVVVVIRFTTSVNKLNNTIQNLQVKLDELNKDHSQLKKQVYKNKEKIIILESDKQS
jgi:peptidoglycan hydrolase CwlO-like protein